MILRFLLKLSFIFLLIGCGKNPIESLKDQIEVYGYILYQTPLAEAGTGTLVGGKPNTMALVAHPQTCFPDSVDQIPTEFRKIDDTDLGHRLKRVELEGDLKVEFLKFMGNSNSTFKVAAGFNHVKELEIEFGSAKIEYFDMIKLFYFYQNQLPQICKDYLNKVGFIVQALRVDSMDFRFKKKDGGYINIEGAKIKEIVDLSLNIKWELIDEYTLRIKTPKYIGYQLGRLLDEDVGHAFYRANKVKKNKYIFKSVSIFGETKDFSQEDEELIDLDINEDEIIEPLERINYF